MMINHIRYKKKAFVTANYSDKCYEDIGSCVLQVVLVIKLMLIGSKKLV